MSILPADFLPPLPLLVAYSGGADSTALLHACWRKWPEQTAAVHIHHGLQPAADDFTSHCRQRCADWNIPLYVHHLDARHRQGQSPEDAARTARYDAFAATVSAHPQYRCIALAQHADDQVETLLLALSRGAGLAGMAAMPVETERGGIRYCRPLLGIAGAALRDYLRRQNTDWIEDPTNQDTRYTRNRIRHLLLPALEEAFPSFRTTFTRSSRHAAQAQALLTEIAEADLCAAGNPPAVKALQALTPARQSNALRHWLQHSCGTQASHAQLQELMRQIAACTTRGHRIQLKIGNGTVQRSAAQLQFLPAIT